MLPYASTVLAARAAAADARLAGHVRQGHRRARTAPTGALGVQAWLDARAPDEERCWRRSPPSVRPQKNAPARTRGHARRAAGVVHPARRVSTPALRDRIAGVLAAAGSSAPVLPTGAGHDAGILAARVPTAMLFVRNPTGISHSPAEHADLADCEAGVAPWPRSWRTWPDGVGGALTASLGPGSPRSPLARPERRWLADLAWLPGQGLPRRPHRSRRRPLHRRHARTAVAASRAATRASAASPCPASPTLTRTPSTARCAATHAGRPRHVLDLARADVRVAARLDPDSYLPAGPGRLRRDGAGRGQLRGGVPLPAPPAGRAPYDDPNAMGRALIQAAAEAGLRMTLLDTCYLSGGLADEGCCRWPGPSCGSATATPCAGPRGSPAWATTPTA